MNKLLLEIDTEKLKEMGFVEENDGTGDPRGVDWNIRNENFHLMVDPWGDVKLARINPGTDFIDVKCESVFDLQNLIDWIT